MDRAVAYYRASTRQQHGSGLGIEAQRARVTRFAEAENGSELGNPTNIQEAGKVGRASLIAAADEHARASCLLLRILRNEGAITIGAITPRSTTGGFRHHAALAGTCEFRRSFVQVCAREAAVRDRTDFIQILGESTQQLKPAILSISAEGQG
jgi:hypothetical protein